jgi:hypothetical protein
MTHVRVEWVKVKSKGKAIPVTGGEGHRIVRLRGWVHPMTIVRLKGLGKLKKNPPHRDSNRDLRASSIEPQPTTVPRGWKIHLKYLHFFRVLVSIPFNICWEFVQIELKIECKIFQFVKCVVLDCIAYCGIETCPLPIQGVQWIHSWIRADTTPSSYLRADRMVDRRDLHWRLRFLRLKKHCIYQNDSSHSPVTGFMIKG